jgi:hypothetical protein
MQDHEWLAECFEANRTNLRAATARSGSSVMQPGGRRWSSGSRSRTGPSPGSSSSPTRIGELDLTVPDA